MMKNKKAWAIAVVAGVLVPVAIWAAGQQFLTPSAAVNCEAGGGCNIAINGGTYNATAPASEQVFGSGVDDTTNFTAVSTTQDIGVGRNLYVAGTLAVTGATTMTNGITFGTGAGITFATGDIAAEKSRIAMSASVTSTPCAFQNTGTTARVISGIGFEYVSTTSVGTITVNVGTSTTAFASSTSPFVSTVLTTAAGKDIVTATSSMNTTSTFNLVTPVYGVLQPNEWLVWKSSTTTNSGLCRALYL